MRAVIVDPTGEPAYGEFQEPAASSGAEVVGVLAAALTNLDVANAEGRHYLSSPDHGRFVIGREAVVQTHVGDRLWINATGLVAPFGSMAERTLALPDHGLPVPEGTSDVIAAAIGNAGLAGWLPLSWRARLQPGETVLILGATGVTGTIAVAAAKRLGAGRVIAAGRNVDALAKNRSFGADAVVDLHRSDLARAFHEAVPEGADVVIDYLNGPPAEAALAVMRTGGRMVQIGSALAAGIHLPAQTARRHSLDILGFAYYHAPIELQRCAYRELCHLATAREIPVNIEILPLNAFAEAWRLQRNGAALRLVMQP